MNLCAGRDPRGTISIPRVSGDEPNTGVNLVWNDTYSPRERG